MILPSSDTTRDRETPLYYLQAPQTFDVVDFGEVRQFSG